MEPQEQVVGQAGASSATSTGPATALMIATYVAGALGIFLAVNGLMGTPANIAAGTFLAVGVTGVLSFLRHSIFHRSDAARMGWDLGHRDNFQIEVGLANLSWGVVSLASVVLRWGTAVQATTFLIMGGYMVFVAAMQWFWPGSQPGARRAAGPLLGLTSYAVALLVVGIWAISRAG